jgi:hypothetical protein
MNKEPNQLKQIATSQIEESPAGKKARKPPEKTYVGKVARTPAKKTKIGEIATGRKAKVTKSRPKKVRKSKKRF